MFYSAYEYIISFVVSFVVAFAFTPVVKRFAFKIGAVDIPLDSRRMHTKPMARLGGLAIFAGYMVALLVQVVSVWLGLSDIFEVDFSILGLTLGSMIIVGVGIVDDIKRLGPRIKMLFQIIAALVVVVSGIRIEFITNPFSPYGLSSLNDVGSILLTVFWIVGITNAINLIDGLDGLAAGVSSIASLTILFIAIMHGDFQTAILTAGITGACLGFLPYNFNPAKIFMGDTGATFLGFVLSIISIQGFKSYTVVAITIPVMTLGLPIFDTIFTIFRRVANGKSPVEADRGHLHHRLIDLGFTQKQSVVLLYCVSALLGLCAIVLSQSVQRAIVVLIAVSVFVITGARYISEVIDDSEGKGDNENSAEDTEKKDKVGILFGSRNRN